MISITETGVTPQTPQESKLEWPCMISITETNPVVNYYQYCIVGMAMYDFDHWNIVNVLQMRQHLVGMAMYDFDHWNPCNLRNEMYPRKLEWPCMISITETDVLFLKPAFLRLEWPCMISITETFCAVPTATVSAVGMAMYDFDHRNRDTCFFLRQFCCWNGHVWFRSLKLRKTSVNTLVASWNGHVWFRSLKHSVTP